MIKLQAREIIRAANRAGINLYRGSFTNCPVGILAREAGVGPISPRGKIARRLRVRKENLVALEMGFEGWTPERNHVWNGPKDMRKAELRRCMKNRYYKVGQRVAELAGLN